MITRCGHRRGGWSLIDAAVAFALLAFLFVGVARFLVTLSNSSEVSVTRAAARREIATAKELLAADFSQLGACGPGVTATRFGGFGIAESGGNNSLSVFVDVDADGDLDLVGWRVNNRTLQRAVTRNTGEDCEQLSLSGASWDNVLDPVDTLPGVTSYFSIIRDGYPAVLAGSCVDGSLDCRADGIQVSLTTQVGGTSGPVRLEAVYPIPGLGL